MFHEMIQQQYALDREAKMEHLDHVTMARIYTISNMEQGFEDACYQHRHDGSDERVADIIHALQLPAGKKVADIIYALQLPAGKKEQILFCPNVW
nr:hypothetical protein [Tanacetum cinerariifolium]